VRKPDPVMLVAGIGIALLGGLLLLDNEGTVNFRFGALAPITFAVVGAIFLASGLSRR